MLNDQTQNLTTTTSFVYLHDHTSTYSIAKAILRIKITS